MIGKRAVARALPPALLVLLGACGVLTGGDDRPAVPGGPCVLTVFRYQDRVYDFQVGPELQGAFVINAGRLRDSLASWFGESSDGVLGRRRRLDGTPFLGGNLWSPIVNRGHYAGTWKVHGDSVRWSFDDDQPTVEWMGQYPWRYDGRSLLADWGDIERLGWSLQAELAC